MKSVSAKSGGAQMIVVVVLVIVAVIGILYFTSDVAKTKIDAAADQYAHWTPENIAKDPENYLNFCETEANKAIQNLKASRIRVAQNRGNLEVTSKDAGEKIAIGQKALGELKVLFSSTASNAWPVTWQGAPREQDWVKRQIVSFARQVSAQEQLKTKVEAGLRQLDNQVTKIEEASSQANEQLSQIKTSRDMLKVQKITDDLKTQLVNISSTLKATINTASESTGTITLDQLKAESATTVDEAEFKKIMGN